MLNAFFKKMPVREEDRQPLSTIREQQSRANRERTRRMSDEAGDALGKETTGDGQFRMPGFFYRDLNPPSEPVEVEQPEVELGPEARKALEKMETLRRKWIVGG